MREARRGQAALSSSHQGCTRTDGVRHMSSSRTDQSTGTASHCRVDVDDLQLSSVECRVHIASPKPPRASSISTSLKAVRCPLSAVPTWRVVTRRGSIRRSHSVFHFDHFWGGCAPLLVPVSRMAPTQHRSRAIESVNRAMARSMPLRDSGLGTRVSAPRVLPLVPWRLKAAVKG